MIQNDTEVEFKFQFACQLLTKPGMELAAIANPPNSSIEFMKATAQLFFEKIRSVRAQDIIEGRIKVTVVSVVPIPNGWRGGEVLYTASMPEQPRA